MPNRQRILGMVGRETARPPKCGECGDSSEVIRLHGQWICRLHQRVKNSKFHQSPRGVILPVGVDDPRPEQREFIPITDIFPNRAARRAAQKQRSRT